MGTKRSALGVKIINERRGPEFKARRDEKIEERHSVKVKVINKRVKRKIVKLGERILIDISCSLFLLEFSI